MINIGQRIKELRESKGITQEELGKLLGYKSRSSINKIELGEQDLPKNKVLECARVLGISVFELLGDDHRLVDQIIYEKSMRGSKLQRQYNFQYNESNKLHLTSPSYFIPQIIHEDTEIFGFIIKDDSMNLVWPENTAVFINPSIRQYSKGDYVYVIIDNLGYVRQVHEVSENVTVIARSSATYANLTLSKSDIAGVIIWWCDASEVLISNGSK